VDLTTLEDLRRLKYRYFRTLDLKQWDEFGDCLTEDAVGRYGTQVYGESLALDSRTAIVDFMEKSLTGGIITVHVAQHPEIEVDGEEAQGSWCFEDTVIVPEYRVRIRGAGYYRDRYRREADGVWRIAETGYERIYEAMESLEDTPSFKLLANRWGKDA
jgi:hypothetical protein